jgi:hypothetical protein
MTACAAAAAFWVAFLPQVVIWHAIAERWFYMPMTGPGEGFDWGHPVLLKVLFSTRHGLFYWSPVLIPAVAGVLALVFSRRGGLVVRCAFVQALIFYYIVSI